MTILFHDNSFRDALPLCSAKLYSLQLKNWNLITNEKTESGEPALNSTLHNGGHYWEHFPVIILNQVAATHLMVGHQLVSSTGARSSHELPRLDCLIGYKESSPNNGCLSLHIMALHDDVFKWKVFRITGPLCGEFIGHRWIALTKASDAEQS